MVVLLVIQSFLALTLIGVILIQKTDSAGLGLGGGGGAGGAFTARGAANFLTRLTAVLAAVFMINCLVMAIVSGRHVNQESSIIQKSLVEEKDAPVAMTPLESPSAPATTPQPGPSAPSNEVK